MKISIYLISSNDSLSSAYTSLPLPAKVDKGLMEKFRGYIFAFKKFNPSRGGCFCDVIDKEDNLAIVLLQQEFFSLIEEIKPALFVCCLREQNDKHVNQYLIDEIRRALANLYSFKEIMGNLKNCQALMLPIRNFSETVVNELPDQFILNSMEKNFREWVEKTVAAIRRTRSPKKSKSGDGKTKYFIDKNKVHFEFGHENHGQFETGKERHECSCEINGLFRFGYRLKETQQFNLTTNGGTISMSRIVDCHGSVSCVKNASHVNMFANDYYTVG